MAHQEYDHYQLQPGTMVTERWRIVEKLPNKDTFTTAYKAIDAVTNNAYVLRTEGVTDEQAQLLMHELTLLAKMKANGDDRHICSIEDGGRFYSFYYAVQPMVGQSLSDLRRARADRRLTVGCAISVGRQCLEALEDVHRAGYVYRDARPSRFHVGLGDQQRRVYLLHFGCARKIKTKPTKPEEPGHDGCILTNLYSKVYSPLIAYDQEEQENWARKDDLEQWMHTLVVLTKGALPWHNIYEARSDSQYKERCRSDEGMDELFAGCPRQFRDAWRLIVGYTFYDTPDYARLYTLLGDALVAENAAEFPYDWELPASATAN